MTRTAVFTDEQWARIEPLMPEPGPAGGRPWDHRQVVEGIVVRYRVGIPWRDLPECFGPWQTVWKRHRRWSQDGMWDELLTLVLAEADAAGEIDWAVSADSTINRAHQHGTNLPRGTGGLSNCKNPFDEPDDHALGRSRGGLGTKIHQLADGRCRPLVVLIGPGQAGDSPMLAILLEQSWVPRIGRGRPRTRPDRLRGDKAYSSRANRTLLRRRGIGAVIAEPEDVKGTRNLTP